jgi:hypothetical protein
VATWDGCRSRHPGGPCAKLPGMGKAKKTDTPKGEDKRVQAGLYMPASLKVRLKVFAAIHGVEMSDVAADAIRLHLDRLEGKK